MSEPLETKESSQQKQRSLNREYIALLGESQGKPRSVATEDGPLESQTPAPMGVWWLVKEYAAGIGLLAPHDLRRTCGK